MVQFQFYEALCVKSGQYNDTDSSSMPLSQCDFSLGGPETGELIRELLQIGKIFTLKLHHHMLVEKTVGPALSIIRNLNTHGK